MTNASFEDVRGVLYEYGSALRGDWGSIDGRCCESELGDLNRYLFVAHRDGDAGVSLSQVRVDAGVCRAGGGHWPDHCDDECTAKITKMMDEQMADRENPNNG